MSHQTTKEVTAVKNLMLKMTQDELSHIIQLANSIKSVSATATFSVGQSVMVSKSVA